MELSNGLLPGPPSQAFSSPSQQAGGNTYAYEGDHTYSPRRWLVLFAFSCSTGANAFMFMDFTVIPEVASQALGLCADEQSAWTEDSGSWDLSMLEAACDSSDALEWTYSASLIAVVPAAPIAMYFLEKNNFATSFIGVLFNCLGAWLRFFAVQQQSLTWAIVSSVMVGFSASVIICSYSSISSRWFPPEQRTFACSIAVQSNYAGWCLGAVLIPYSVGSKEAMHSAMLLQALAVSSTMVSFLLFQSKPPPGHASAAHEGSNLPAGKSLQLLFANRQFMLQCMCYSILAGVSFGVPGFQTGAFKGLLSAREAAWTNFAFIITGVVVGISMGAIVKDSRRFALTLKAMFIVASVGMAGLVLLMSWAEQGGCQPDGAKHDRLFAALLLAMAVTGGSTLGFIGIALAAVAQATAPVSAEYSGGLVEIFIQIYGAALAQVGGAVGGSLSFWICGLATWAATLLLLAGYRAQPDGTQDPLLRGGRGSIYSSDSIYG